MIAITTGNAIVDSIVGVVILVALVVVWRVVIHDPTIRRIRFGVFWERERNHHDDDPDDYPTQEKLYD